MLLNLEELDVKSKGVMQVNEKRKRLNPTNMIGWIIGGHPSEY